jgi:hypothetical protein
VVVPVVEALLMRALRRRAGDAPATRPNRLVSARHEVDSLGFVADHTSVLLLRPGTSVEVLPAGSLVVPTLLGRGAPAYAVVSHLSVDVWLRVGPFDTIDDRTVRQVELRMTVTLADSPSGLRDLVESATEGRDPSDPLDLDDVVLERLAREVTARTTDAVRRRTLVELTGISLGVLLDDALPTTFLGGLVDRSALEVVDVDWPTEGRGWPVVPVPGAVGAPDPQGR